MRVTRGLLSVIQWLLVQTHPGDPALMVALVVTTEALPLNKLHVILLDRAVRACNCMAFASQCIMVFMSFQVKWHN